jgi:hypothetical protein
MDPLLLGLPMGAVVASGLALDARRAARDAERDRVGWRAYATAHGFRYSTGGRGLSFRAHHRLEGAIRGVPVSCVTGPGILKMPTTTVTAQASLPIAGRVYVSCTDAFAQARGDVLAQRVDLSDAKFNGSTFFVHATSQAPADRALSPTVRSLLLLMHAAGRQSLNFRCERDRVAVEWLGVEPLPELLDLGCRLVLAACEPRGRQGAYR